MSVAADIFWSRGHVVSSQNISDEDNRLADRGIVAPGETLNGREVQLRLQLMELTWSHLIGPTWATLSVRDGQVPQNPMDGPPTVVP